MNANNVVTLIIGVLTVVASVIASRYSRRGAVEVATVGAEQGAYLRAEGIYKNAIDRLEQERDEDRQRITELEAEVRDLKARLRQAGITDIEL